MQRGEEEDARYDDDVVRLSDRWCRPVLLRATGSTNNNGHLLVDGGEVLEGALRVRLHALRARLPAGGAHLAMGVRELRGGVGQRLPVECHHPRTTTQGGTRLEGLEQAQRLVHIAADRQVVDGALAQDALVTDDEQPPARRAAAKDSAGQRHTHSRSGGGAPQPGPRPGPRLGACRSATPASPPSSTSTP